MVRWLACSALVIGAIAGCKSHWTAEVTQPVLTLQADKTARTSMPLTILLRDMELRYVRLANTAYYVVVSRDRLRFHVTLRHKWESMSDLRTWQTWVEDAAGVHHPVEEVHQQVMQLGFGRVPVYRGVGDFTAYGRDLSASEQVTLVLRRPGYEYRYVWRSESDPEDEPRSHALRSESRRTARPSFVTGTAREPVSDLGPRSAAAAAAVPP